MLNFNIPLRFVFGIEFWTMLFPLVDWPTPCLFSDKGVIPMKKLLRCCKYSTRVHRTIISGVQLQLPVKKAPPITKLVTLNH